MITSLVAVFCTEKSCQGSGQLVAEVLCEDLLWSGDVWRQADQRGGPLETGQTQCCQTKLCMCVRACVCVCPFIRERSSARPITVIWQIGVSLEHTVDRTCVGLCIALMLARQ